MLYPSQLLFSISNGSLTCFLQPWVPCLGRNFDLILLAGPAETELSLSSGRALPCSGMRWQSQSSRGLGWFFFPLLSQIHFLVFSVEPSRAVLLEPGRLRALCSKGVLHPSAGPADLRPEVWRLRLNGTGAAGLNPGRESQASGSAGLLAHLASKDTLLLALGASDPFLSMVQNQTMENLGGLMCQSCRQTDRSVEAAATPKASF